MPARAQLTLLFVANLKRHPDAVLGGEGALQASLPSHLCFYESFLPMQKCFLFMRKWSVFPLFSFVSGLCVLPSYFLLLRLYVFSHVFSSSPFTALNVYVSETSLAAQRLRTHPAMQATWVRPRAGGLRSHRLQSQ